MNLIELFNKVTVLHKGELLCRVFFSFRSHLGFFSIKNFENVDVKAKRLDIFNNDSIKTRFNNKCIDYDNLICELKSFKKNNKPWYKLSIDDFDGDIRKFWEFNRLQFLNVILNKYLQTNDSIYIEQINNILNIWFLINPLEKGYCHISNLEIAIRSIVFYRIWYYLRDKLTIDLEKVLFVYGSHIFNDLPRTNICNPNNHSLGEAVSLYLLSCVFDMKKWERIALKTILKRLKLFSIDGNSVEESSGYLLFKAQMLIFLRNIGCKLNNQIDLILPKIIYELNSISDGEGNIALFGDCDEGLFYVFDSLKKNNVKQLSIDNFANYNTLNNLFNKSQKIDSESSNYLLTMSSGKIKIALIGGYEINHGHNQCLSICVWKNSKQVLFLPGTFQYNNIPFSKRMYYCGLKRQNCPRTYDRSNLITTFRHKQIIKKTKLFLENNQLCGILETKKEKIFRKIQIKGDYINVYDVSNRKLLKFSICCNANCEIICKNGDINKEVDFFSQTYGDEIPKEYITITPSCNYCDFIIKLK